MITINFLQIALHIVIPIIIYRLSGAYYMYKHSNYRWSQKDNVCYALKKGYSYWVTIAVCVLIYLIRFSLTLELHFKWY